MAVVLKDNTFQRFSEAADKVLRETRERWKPPKRNKLTEAITLEMSTAMNEIHNTLPVTIAFDLR